MMLRTTLSLSSVLVTFSKALDLGTFFALSIAAVIILFLYFLSTNIFFSSLSLWSLDSSVEHILTILRAKL